MSAKHKHISSTHTLPILCCFFLLSLCCLLLGGCSGLENTTGQAYSLLESTRPEAGTTQLIDLQGQAVPVALFFPQGYSKSRLFPACIVVRSAGHALLQDLQRAASQKGFVLAIAELPDTHTDDEHLTLWLETLMDLLQRDYAVNAKRIALLGRGTDAETCMRQVCALSHRLAGLALIEGGHVPVGCRPVQPIPVIGIGNDGPGAVMSFWAHNNRCVSPPQTTRKNGLTRTRYTCPLPHSAVQHYGYLEGQVEDAPSTIFPAAWTIFEFLERQSAP